jgi:hypothetical protein
VEWFVIGSIEELLFARFLQIVPYLGAPLEWHVVQGFGSLVALLWKLFLILAFG